MAGDITLDKVNELLAKLSENTERRAAEAREAKARAEAEPGDPRDNEPVVDRRVQELQDDYVIVVAIDFGTTFSGYAFSFRNNAAEVRMNKNWGAGFNSYKTPTTLLLEANGKFKAFGYEAEKLYAEQAQEDGSMYFLKFKMKLHNPKDLNLFTQVEAANGKKHPAIDVFGKSLKYLSEQFMNTIQSIQGSAINKKYIRWVITVPAIWTDAAKQFMRQAALKGGLIDSDDSGQLIIALEPEAASLHCRTLEVSRFNRKYMYGTVADSDSLSLPAGTKYMVIDAGGGTLDVTCHEIQENGTVKELHAASGGAYGGIKVDQEFEVLIKEIFGASFIEKFQKDCASSWLAIMIDFEKKKRAIKVNENDPTNLTIPYTFGTKFKELTGNDVEKVVQQTKVKGVTFTNGMLRLTAHVMRQLFEPVKKSCVQHIKDLMKKPDLSQLQYIFMVGGFSECSVLQEAISDEFKKKVKVLIPEDAGLAVMKGAVLFGHHPTAIEARVSAKTYGIECRVDYIEGYHEPSRKVKIDGHDKVERGFSVFVVHGQEIKDGYSCTSTYYPSSENQKECEIRILSTEQPEVKYSDENGVDRQGVINFEWPGKGFDRKVAVTMTFGMTEIHVGVVIYPGEKKAETQVNFLSK